MGTRKQQAKETSTLHLINNDMPRFANTRRQSRECTLHMLYAFDNCSMDEKAVFECFDPLLPVEIPYREFAVTIFRGVCENQKEIDSLIEKYADNWEISRMTVIDRNIIRLAAYEILYMPKTPISVIIDEAKMKEKPSKYI